jgi:CheY-like chemotaxis protein
MEKTFRIVVADDDLDDQDLISRAFKDAKVKVIIIKVYDGLQLLDYLLKRETFKGNKDRRPDLIFLDLNMPLMDGFTALKEIKSAENFKDIPIYVITTSRSETEKAAALNLGASGFYRKGTSSGDIKRIVQEVCFDCFT